VIRKKKKKRRRASLLWLFVDEWLIGVWCCSWFDCFCVFTESKKVMFKFAGRKERKKEEAELFYNSGCINRTLMMGGGASFAGKERRESGRGVW
jgi:hypothetical protein